MSETNAQNEIIEEHDANLGTGVEAEDSESEASSVERPYDPTKIRVDPKTFSLRQIIDMIEDGDLDLAPDFQRKKVWKSREKSRLIESILLRIPLPAFYFSADPDGRLRVVDGLQRLSTVHDFVKGGEDGKGGFDLRDLEYLGDGILGSRFAELETTWARRIQQTQIFVNVIDPQTPQRIKFDIFKRLNTGGTPLNAQEIRHCMSSARSREFLKACAGGYGWAAPGETMVPFAKYKAEGGVLSKGAYEKANAAAIAFGEATNWKMYDHVRMADREMILRFSAFRLIGPELDEYGSKTAMDAFLTDAAEKIDSKLTDKKLSELATDLDRAMKNAREVFGDHAFRKWALNVDWLNPINRALFESWAVALADYELTDLKPHKAKIVEAARNQMSSNADYINAISSGTGDHARVKLRFQMAREILAEAVG